MSPGSPPLLMSPKDWTYVVAKAGLLFPIDMDINNNSFPTTSMSIICRVINCNHKIN